MANKSSDIQHCIFGITQVHSFIQIFCFLHWIASCETNPISFQIHSSNKQKVKKKIIKKLQNEKTPRNVLTWKRVPKTRKGKKKKKKNAKKKKPQKNFKLKKGAKKKER